MADDPFLSAPAPYSDDELRQRYAPTAAEDAVGFEPKPRTDFAASTIEATKWLAKYQPDRLDDWCARHHSGLREACGIHVEKPFGS